MSRFSLSIIGLLVACSCLAAGCDISGKVNRRGFDSKYGVFLGAEPEDDYFARRAPSVFN